MGAAQCCRAVPNENSKQMTKKRTQTNINAYKNNDDQRSSSKESDPKREIERK